MELNIDLRSDVLFLAPRITKIHPGTMKRIHLFEFEDLQWFPRTWRTSMTHLIVVLQKMMGVPEVISKLIGEIREKHSFDQIVDTGSGSGGALLNAVELYNQEHPTNPIKLRLTDLNPLPEFVESVNQQNNPNLHYQLEPVDARHLDQAPAGLKTMMNSFHHMPPPVAKDILKSAVDNRQPLLIYEMAENKVPLPIWWLLLPLSLAILTVMTWFMTPFVRPLTAKQLLFTYLIPVIPIAYAWDGQVSSVRMYTFDDVEFLLKGLQHDTYEWTVDRPLKKKGKPIGYYILGLPK